MNPLGIFFLFITIFASATVALSNHVPIEQQSESTDTTITTAKQRIATKGVYAPAGPTITQAEFTLPIIPESLFINGTYEPLFDNGFAFPIEVTVKKISESSVQLILHCVNTATYSVRYSSVDGLVFTTAQLEKSNNPGPPREIQIEERLQKIFEKLDMIKFDAHFLELISREDSGVAFGVAPTPVVSAQRAITADDNVLAIVSNGGHQIGAVEVRSVVPGTYMRYGKFQRLYRGFTFPITIETERIDGTTLKVTMKAVNTITYELTYNNADGWVSNCVLKEEIESIGTSDQMVTEDKIKDIIDNIQQIAFEKNGRIQFIADNGDTRISFDPAPRQLP